MELRFGSVCSGIEAASVAWGPLGWRAAWLAEIEPFPSAVLKHHYPEVPNLGDMTALPSLIRAGRVEAPDLFCGGTPCQAFSVAGLRKSLEDARGNLSLTFCEIADAIDDVRRLRGEPPAVVFWENVPGVLSTKDNAFGCFLAGLAGEDDPLVAPGGKWTNAGVVLGPKRAVAWRVLDAQYFGVAQRRRRVFVVASARDGFDPAEVLFEFDGVRRDSAPSREAGQDAAKCLTTGTGKRFDWETEDILPVTHSLRGEGFDASEDGTGRGTPLVPVAFSAKDYGGDAMQDLSPTLRAGGHNTSHANAGVMSAIAFHPTQDPISSTDGTTHCMGTGSSQGNATVAVAVGTDCFNGQITGDVAATMGTRGSSQNSSGPTVMHAMQVRRLTPVECERLQGFPDGWTQIPWRNKPASECPDGPRYKALGNSWAVPVVAWIGRRIGEHLCKSN